MQDLPRTRRAPLYWLQSVDALCKGISNLQSPAMDNSSCATPTD